MTALPKQHTNQNLDILLLQALARNAVKVLVKALGYEEALKACDNIAGGPQVKGALIGMHNRGELDNL